MTPLVDAETLERVRASLPWMCRQDAEIAMAGISGQVLQRCAADIQEWLRFVVTRDEADPEHPVKPFPIHLDYMRRLMTLLTREQRLAIVKSRQMLVSWAACAAMVFRARFTPHQAVLYQTQNWPDAVKMVAMPGSGQDGGFAGRCQFIEQHLPHWMRQTVTATEGRLIYPNGSIIEALPGGADKIRSKTASMIVLDEMAFLEDAKGTYTAIAPLVQKGASLVMISTPNGAESNVFFHLWHGTPLTVSQAA